MIFYVKDNEPFIPDEINPVFALTAKAVLKAAKLNLTYTMRTTSLQNAAKSGNIEKMSELMQKVFQVNGKKYAEFMEMSGAEFAEVDDSFFADKDVEFYRNQINILCDFAAISVVIEHRLFGAMSEAIKRRTGKNTEEIKFFTNQTEIIPVKEEEPAEE